MVCGDTVVWCVYCAVVEADDDWEAGDSGRLTVPDAAPVSEFMQVSAHTDTQARAHIHARTYMHVYLGLHTGTHIHACVLRFAHWYTHTCMCT